MQLDELDAGQLVGKTLLRNRNRPLKCLLRKCWVEKLWQGAAEETGGDEVEKKRRE